MYNYIINLITKRKEINVKMLSYYNPFAGFMSFMTIIIIVIVLITIIVIIVLLRSIGKNMKETKAKPYSQRNYQSQPVTPIYHQPEKSNSSKSASSGGFCRMCGSQTEKEATFCQNCGSKL